MSEQRRATLTPFGTSDKKSSKSLRKTFRLSFTLSDPNENSCPVLDYAGVVKSEERKLLKKHHFEKEKKPNGVTVPFEDNDEEVRRIARHLEEKYGDKKKKLKSYAELGAGYDETDPFIDNTDAYDEALQEDQETACGGYYINSGPLELKRVEVSDQSDADEVKQRGRKRAPTVIDEEEENRDEGEGGGEGVEEEEEHKEETKSTLEDGPSDSKKAKLSDERLEPENPPPPNFNGLEEQPVKKKKKRIIEDNNPDGNVIKTKKAKTVKALLEEKRIQEQPTVISEEPKRQIASETSIAEAIESVVNAGNVQDENSISSNSSQSDSSSSASDDSQDGKPQGEESGGGRGAPLLPDSLSPDVVALVDHIKRTASLTDNTRKTFCAEINNSLIKLEWKTKELTAGNRNLLFSHLAHHLPCTKSTLMRRAKKLFIHKEDSQIETIICKLKATIDATMPSLLENYGKECQKVAEEKSLASSELNTQGEENKHSSPSAHLPKRRFPWNDETRGYLMSIIKCKQRCFKVLKPRKSSWEEWLKLFLHSRIRTLWPDGWMRYSILIREINRTSISLKSKHTSHHRPSKAESSRLNVSMSYSPPTSSNGSLYVSPSTETPQQPKKSPVMSTTPLAAKTESDPINLLSKITSSLNTSSNHPKKSHSPGHQHSVTTEKPETFFMDSLLKRTSDIKNCNDYNTTLSDLIKKEGVIMNGTSLPLKTVNSSQQNNNSRSEKILDLSSCNSSISGTPSVIQSAVSSERTPARNGDCATSRASSVEKMQNHTSAIGKESMKDVEKRLSEETTTATDILSQIISESLLSPPQHPSSTVYSPSMVKDEVKSKSGGVALHKSQELLYDVMQDLKELNHMSSGGGRDNKHDGKSTSFTGASWAYPVKSSESSKSNQYHNEFLKHLYSNQDPPISSSTPTTPYSRHNASSYDSSTYGNEINKPVYTPSPHRTSQSLPSHVASPSNKLTQMKNHPSTGISSGSEPQSHQ